jgi:hypothetical protein
MGKARRKGKGNHLTMVEVRRQIHHLNLVLEGLS